MRIAVAPMTAVSVAAAILVAPVPSAIAAVSVQSAGTFDGTSYTVPDAVTNGSVVITAPYSIVGSQPIGASMFTSLVSGAMSFNYGSLMQSINVLWGTPDAYNVISFFNGANSVGSISGSGLSEGFYKLTSSLGFDKVVFSTGSSCCFETTGALSPVAMAVPGPVAAAGLPATFALVGYALYRRRRNGFTA